MPTYEYLCESCGYRFEKFQNMSDAPIKECPKCGKELKKLIGTGIAVISKSKGLHQTDYKNSNDEGKTCCGRDEPCDTPPCSDDGICER